MWTSIPDNQAKKIGETVLALQARDTAGHLLFAVAPTVDDKKNVQNAAREKAAEMLRAFCATHSDADFHPEYIEVWHARHIPGHSTVIGRNPWETQDSYSGPADTTVFVYIPLVAAEKHKEKTLGATTAAKKGKRPKKAPAAVEIQ